MTDTNKDFFRWTRDKQGAFSKTLKDELDKKMPKSGGTMTGPLEISFHSKELQVEKLATLRVTYGEPIRHNYSWTIGLLNYSPIAYVYCDNVRLFGISSGLGIFPNNPKNSSFTLGYYGSRWPNVYTKKLNNGGDIEIPEKAGTMALLSDIEDILRKYNLIPQQEPEVPDDGTQE